MSILINDGKVAEEDIIKCDIGEFVLLVEKMRKHTGPVVDVINYGISIFRLVLLQPILHIYMCCVKQ